MLQSVRGQSASLSASASIGPGPGQIRVVPPPPSHTIGCARWLSVDSAAAVLDLTPSALRRALERRARVASDGAVVAEFDGVRARKLGRLWRVQLGHQWLEAPSAPALRSRMMSGLARSTAKEK